jgi:hypothetical protein
MAQYCSDRLSGLLALGCALPFLAFAAAIVWAVGLHFLVLALTFFAGLIVWAALGTMATVITVDDQGLRRTPNWWRGTKLSWDDVECWVVMTDRFDHSRKARFRIRGKWFPLEVHDVDVFRPGFDAFLVDLRSRISPKETTGTLSPCR